MDRITKSLKIAVSSEMAFQKFVNELNEWWPKEYTWSQDKLEKIEIDGRKTDYALKLVLMDSVVIGELLLNSQKVKR